MKIEGYNGEIKIGSHVGWRSQRAQSGIVTKISITRVPNYAYGVDGKYQQIGHRDHVYIRVKKNVLQGWERAKTVTIHDLSNVFILDNAHATPVV